MISIAKLPQSLEVFNTSSYLINELIAPTRKTKRGKKPVFNQTNKLQHPNLSQENPLIEHGEILTFFEARKDEHITNLNVIDGQDKFEKIITKWNKITIQVVNVGCSNQLKNGATCKDKWVLL